LGLGTGFRPDLLAYLFPLWALSSWKATQSWKPLAQGGLIIGALAACWTGAVVYAMGGIASTAVVLTSYLAEQSSKDSILFSRPEMWFRPFSRLVIWNAIAIAGWCWVPIIATRTTVAKSAQWSFLLLWLVPGLFVQLLIHIAAPGHTLFATPAWSIMGACFISYAGKHRDVMLATAACVGAALFLNVIPTGYPPSPGASFIERAWISAKNAIAFGTFETSMNRLRWWDETAEVSVKELSQLSAKDRPNLTVILNGNDMEFDFVNWRVVSYYLSDRPLVVLLDNLVPGSAGRVRWVRGKDVRFAAQRITIPADARILWIMLPGGRFHRALEQIMPVQRGRYVLYTNPPYPRSFRIEGFEFVLQDDESR
jgi:hypothetical protein